MTDVEPTPDAPEDAPAGEAPADEPAVQSYRILKEYVAYGDKRAVAGDVVDDLPDVSVGWLLSDGWIEKA